MQSDDFATEMSEWQFEFWRVSEEHGFHESPHDNPYEKAALVHSEISEAVEELRKGYTNEVYYRESDGKPEGVGIELADALIRIFDLAEMLNINLWDCVVEKHTFNIGRRYMHGKGA